MCYLVGKKTQGLLDEFYGREKSRIRSGLVFIHILRLQQLMSPPRPFPWMNFLAPLVLSILRRRHPELIFILIQLVWPEFLKSSLI